MPGTTPTVTAGGVQHAASYALGAPIAPGTMKAVLRTADRIASMASTEGKAMCLPIRRMAIQDHAAVASQLARWIARDAPRRTGEA